MQLSEDLGGRPATADPTGEDAREHSAGPTHQSITPAIPDFHPAANLFPLMDEATLAELAADIAANGLREPIWRHPDGRIIDGRNRLRACLLAEVECRHRTYDRSDETIVSFVVSKNLHRRHLTTAQRSAVAAELANLTRGDNQHSREHPSIAGTSQAEAAKLMGVRVASVERAVAVKRADPEMHERVKAGELTAAQARAAIAAAAAPSPPDPDPDLGVDEPELNDGNRAAEAIAGVARLKMSGTKAARDWQWSDDEIALAEKALKWIRMFVHVARRDRDRR